MKKVFVLLISLILMTTAVPGCRNATQVQKDDSAVAKMLYASEMWFTSDAGTWTSIISHYSDGEYNDCVLVRFESEKGDYADNVVVAWPTETTERILLNLNYYIDYTNVDLTPYSLSFPITMSDLVDKWGNVYDLLHNGLDDFVWEYLRNPEHKLWEE